MFKDLIEDGNRDCNIESFISKEITGDDSMSSVDVVYIDAGTRHLRLQACAHDGTVLYDNTVASNSDLHDLLLSAGLIKTDSDIVDPAKFVITGKLAAAIRERLGGGKQILSTAAFWLVAQDLIELPENANGSEEHTSELQSRGLISYAVFCLKKKTHYKQTHIQASLL